MRKTLTFALFASASLAAFPAQAASILGLVNTGVNVSGVPGSGGTDVNWTLSGGPAYVTVPNLFPVGTNWVNNNATSSWISPTANQGTSLDPTLNGNYLYALNFDLTGFHADTANFGARLLVDNRISSITLNGNTIFSGFTGGFGASDWFAFSANSGFVNGNNVLQINAVNETQGSGNPTGLRVEFLESQVAAVPEPSAWALMIAGFALTGFAMRRRRNAVVKMAVS